MEGNLHIGVSLEWKWNDNVRCSMPKHIPNLMNKLKLVPLLQPQNSPYPAPHIECGKKIQTPLPEDGDPLLPEQGEKFVQSTIGAALCLAIIIDSNLLVPCNELAMQQTTATTKTLSSCKFMLDHMVSNPDPSRICYKSDVQLWVASDASYLSVSKSRSRVGGFHYLGHAPGCSTPLPQQQKFLNSPIQVEEIIIKPVVSSASESEIAAGYANPRKAIPLRVAFFVNGTSPTFYTIVNG